MKTNVQPGMLAYVVARPGGIVYTPEIIGRIVFVEGPAIQGYIYTHVDGRQLRDGRIHTEPVWRVSAKSPLPVRASSEGMPEETWYVYERTIFDACLRPLIDPNLDISDEEVKELYSTKKEDCVV